MKTLFLALVFVATCVFAQTPEPSLAQIKIAADAGDPAAQDKLAQQFILHTDTVQAEIWYRKAAEQHFAHAQGQLGHLLLLRSRTSVGLKPADRTAMGEEAARWITLAANQGDKQGQANLADLCLKGELVKQDLVEAYKWGELASQGSMLNGATISGRSTRDAAILKMDAGQIAEARKRAAEFVPHQMKQSEMPEPAWVKQVKLNGISGTGERRLAVINNQSLQKDDTRNIKVANKTVTIHCIEVKESSVVVTIKGLDGQRELKMAAQ